MLQHGDVVLSSCHDNISVLGLSTRKSGDGCNIITCLILGENQIADYDEEDFINEDDTIIKQKKFK